MRALPTRRLPGRATLLYAIAMLALAAPFAVVAARYLATSRPVFLGDDLALVDLHVRDALHWQQDLGPFDRFGWNHPGPAVYYLLSVSARILGSGARSEFVGAIVLNLLAALGTVWVVRRRAGALAALWCATCLGVLGVVLGSTSPGATTLSESPLGALVTPWNPDIVIFPLVLFCVLAAAGASGSTVSLLGAALVGSFAVQTNVSTLPLVVVLLGAAALWRLISKVSRRSDLHGRTSPAAGEPAAEAETEPPDAPHTELSDEEGGRPLAGPGALGRRSGSRALLGVAGCAVLVVMWLPPLVQQFADRRGNFTLIWRFFTASHPTVSLPHAFWAALAADSEVAFGVAQEMSSRRLGQPHLREAVVLALLLIVAVAAVLIGARRRQGFACALGVASLLGFAVAIESVTRIVGPVYGYLIVWEVAVPVAALIGLGSAVLALDEAALGRRMRRGLGHGHDRRPRALDVATAALVGLTVLVGSLLTVEACDIPPLQRASDPTVAAAWKLVSAHVRPGREHVFVGDAGTSIQGLFTFFGLVDQLQEHGYHPRVSSLWATQVGPHYVSDNREPLQIVLYPPSGRAGQTNGYIGHTQYADIRVAPGPPTP
jgi:hypothetical protein